MSKFNDLSALEKKGRFRLLFSLETLKIILRLDSNLEPCALQSISLPQHDELEPNLKKILHRNGIWGLEAIVM